MKFWKTHQKDLILDILRKAQEQELELTLWQQISESQRRVFKVAIKEFDTTQLVLKLFDSDTATIDLFEKQRPYYLHIKGVEAILKRDRHQLVGDILTTSFPGQVQIFEKRKSRRYYYKYQDYKNITVQSVEVDPQTEEPLFTLSSVLVDISTSGAGMVADLTQVKGQLQVGKKLVLLNLTDQRLPEPFQVKVNYLKVYNDEKGSETFKVGLEFDDQLDSVSYKSISSIIEHKIRKVQGIDPGRWCGLDYEDQVSKLNELEKQDPQLGSRLKDNIEYLDKLRYTTIKMKSQLLASVNQDKLAAALRLSSKELIFDLLIDLSDNMREDFLDKLNEEKAISVIDKSQVEVVQAIRELEGSGSLVLDPTSFDTLV